MNVPYRALIELRVFGTKVRLRHCTAPLDDTRGYRRMYA